MERFSFTSSYLSSLHPTSSPTLHFLILYLTFLTQGFFLYPPLLCPLLFSSFYVSISPPPPRLLCPYYHLYPQLLYLPERLWSFRAFIIFSHLPVDLLLCLVSILWAARHFHKPTSCILEHIFFIKYNMQKVNLCYIDK